MMSSSQILKKIGAALIVILAALLLVFAARYRLYFQLVSAPYSAARLSAGWFIMEDGERRELTLPALLEVPQDRDTLVLYNDSLSAFPPGRVICTQAAVNEPVIRQGGRTLYRYMDSGFRLDDPLKEEMYCRAEVDTGTGCAPLEISFHSRRGSSMILMPEVFIGSRRSIMYYIFQNSLDVLLISGLMLLLAVTAFLLRMYYTYIQRGNMNTLLLTDISLFLLVAGVWFFSNSGLALSLFAPEITSVIGCLQFFSFNILPVPVLLMLRRIGVFSCGRHLDILNWCFIVNAFGQGILILATGIHYERMLPATYLLMVIMAVSVIAFMLRQYNSAPSGRLLKILLEFAFFCFCSLLAVAIYSMKGQLYRLLTFAGMLVFVIYILYDIVAQSEEYASVKEREAMGRRRTMDPLTGLPDGRILDSDLEWNRSRAGEGGGVSMVQAEILLEGEALNARQLAATGFFMRRAFAEGSMCYRTGEERFCVLVPGTKKMTGEKQLEKQLAGFAELVGDYNRQAPEEERIRWKVSGALS